MPRVPDGKLETYRGTSTVVMRMSRATWDNREKREKLLHDAGQRVR